MIKQLKKIKFSDKLSLSVALIGIILALWANFKAAEANRIAQNANNISATANAISVSANDISRKANDLAIESNKIAKQEAQPHPRIVNGPDFDRVMVLTCKTDDSSTPYGAIIAATPSFDVVNYGAQAIWLFNTDWLDEGRKWDITLHEQYGLVPEPYNLAPESEHKWIIVALHSAYFAKKEEAIDYLDKFPSYFKVEVKFTFENGTNLTWPFTLSVFSTDIDNDFETPCAQHFWFFATQY
jgi:hypothetical protein